jgi:DNA-binding MarR family transcriptional regulator
MAGSGDVVDGIRADWERLNPGVDTSIIEIAGRILRAAALVARRGDEFLVRYELGRGEFDLLSALRRAGAPQRPGDLRTISLATGPATTKRLKALEARGLVARSSNPADGRSALIALTAEGERLIDRVFPELLAVERELFAAIPGAARPVLERSLRTALAALDPASL